MTKQISDERKTAYYLGMVLMVIGGFLFFSVFVTGAMNEANVSLGGEPDKVVVIKCPACGKLNEEDSKFCQECGKKI